jgi:dipeptidyl aminopeptidase/acylaminoacyl peptidase
MRLRVTYALLIGLLFTAISPARDLITATDLLRIREAVDVVMARDGSFAVYTVQSIAHRANPGEDALSGYIYEDHLWMINLHEANAKPVQLTFDGHRDTAPAISPDGTRLAFVRIDATTKNAKPQIWVMPLSEAGEPRLLTNLEFGGTDPRWAPDGDSLLVTSAIPMSKLPGKPPFSQERPKREWEDFDPSAGGKPVDARPDSDWRSIRKWLEQNSRQQNPDVIFRMDFLGEQGLEGERRFNQLFRVDSRGTNPRTVQLTNSFVDHSGAALPPDGRKIVFAARPPSEGSPDQAAQRSSIWIMNSDGSNERVLLNDDRYNFWLPQFTADGKHILSLGAQSDEPTYRQTALVMCDADGARPEWLTPDGDPSVQQPRTLDDKAYYTVNFEGGQQLRVVDLKTKQIKTLVDGPAGVNVFAVAPGRLVYGLITVPDPSELYVSTGNRSQTVDPKTDALPKTQHRRPHPPLPPMFERASVTRRLTDLNASWLERKELSLPEEHWIRRPDGTRVQYWVMKPAGFEPGKQYPWVVEMHGGPAVMWGPGELTMWHEFQTMCAFGFGVLYVNPRGSSGYGYPFQRANYKDWGDGPMSDVLAALDDAMMTQPAIDHRRLFLTGGSYAGYLTAWIIEHDHRFKAAAAQRGVYDLATFFGEGNAFRLVPNDFGGYPWEPDTRRLLQQQSPMTYVNQIETPLLILHGSNDYRTGVVQSQMLFRALKEMGKPVEYVRYPGAGHELTRSGAPAQRIDHLLRIVEFFARYAESDRPAPGSKQAQ